MICPRYALDMPKICLRYAHDKPMICPRYAHDMPMICLRYAQDMLKICLRYVHDISNICPWYALDMPNICLSYAWFDKISKTLMTEWVSNMDPRDASASKKLFFCTHKKISQKFQGKSIHFTRLLKLWLANSMSDLKYCSQGLSPCRQHYWKIEFLQKEISHSGK